MKYTACSDLAKFALAFELSSRTSFSWNFDESFRVCKSLIRPEWRRTQATSARQLSRQAARRAWRAPGTSTPDKFRAMKTSLSADEVIAALDLAPHPEGGWFRETFRETS